MVILFFGSYIFSRSLFPLRNDWNWLGWKFLLSFWLGWIKSIQLFFIFLFIEIVYCLGWMIGNGTGWVLFLCTFVGICCCLLVSLLASTVRNRPTHKNKTNLLTWKIVFQNHLRNSNNNSSISKPAFIRLLHQNVCLQKISQSFCSVAAADRSGLFYP